MAEMVYRVPISNEDAKAIVALINNYKPQTKNEEKEAKFTQRLVELKSKLSFYFYEEEMENETD